MTVNQASKKQPNTNRKTTKQNKQTNKDTQATCKQRQPQQRPFIIHARRMLKSEEIIAKARDKRDKKDGRAHQKQKTNGGRWGVYGALFHS